VIKLFHEFIALQSSNFASVHLWVSHFILVLLHLYLEFCSDCWEGMCHQKICTHCSQPCAAWPPCCSSTAAWFEAGTCVASLSGGSSCSDSSLILRASSNLLFSPAATLQTRLLRQLQAPWSLLPSASWRQCPDKGDRKSSKASQPSPLASTALTLILFRRTDTERVHQTAKHGCDCPDDAMTAESDYEAHNDGPKKWHYLLKAVPPCVTLRSSCCLALPLPHLFLELCSVCWEDMYCQKTCAHGLVLSALCCMASLLRQCNQCLAWCMCGGLLAGLLLAW